MGSFVGVSAGCRLILERPAEKALNKLPERESRRIRERLSQLALSPSCERRLRGRLEGLCRARVGAYRIAYYLSSCEVRVIRIGRRESVYET